MSQESTSSVVRRRHFLAMSGALAAATAARVGALPSQSTTASLGLSGPATAVLLIDLQNSNVNTQFAPVSFANVTANALHLADKVRQSGGLVVFTRVIVQQVAELPTDTKLPRGAMLSNRDDLVSAVKLQPGDVLVTKRQWGAFYQTDLEEQLRRRSIKTIILAGVATEAGVDSTARAALDRRYALVFASDAVSGAASTSDVFVDKIFPVLGRVRTTAQIVDSFDRPPS